MGSYVIYTCQSCGKRCQKGAPIRCLYCNKLLCWSCQKSKLCPQHYQSLTPDERSVLKTTHDSWGALASLCIFASFASFIAMCVLFGTQVYWAGALAIGGIVLGCYGSIKLPGIRDKKVNVIRRQISERLRDGGSDHFIDVPLGGGRSIVANRAVLNALIAQKQARVQAPAQAQPSDVIFDTPVTPVETPQPQPTNPTGSQMLICASCGKPNAATNGFCMNCGQKLQ